MQALGALDAGPHAPDQQCQLCQEAAVGGYSCKEESTAARFPYSSYSHMAAGVTTKVIAPTFKVLTTRRVVAAALLGNGALTFRLGACSCT